MTMYRSSLVKAFLFALSVCSTAQAGKVSSSLKIHLPKDLTRVNGYDHREALFGIPPYGGSIQQNVVYADHDMCTPPTNANWKSPFFLLVDRGSCSFVQKVRNAQHAGAAAVIIADNTCQCSHEKVCTPEANTECEKHEPIMADDGSGFDITIPSVLMFKQDADPIKEQLKKKKTVRIELQWSLPNPDDHVEWDLWTSPTDFVSTQFKAEFGDAVKALGNTATFKPHMYIYDGLDANCRDDEGKTTCFNLCTNEGRYCATDPDGDIDFGISGADVVTESIRRLCIWEVYGDDGVGQEWWDYVRVFTEKCDTSAQFMKDACVRAVMEEIDMDYDMVDQCIFRHGGLEDDVSNDALDTQLDDKESNGIVIMPVVYVNGVAVRGALEFAVVFKALCAGYAEGTAPVICNQCASCADEKECVLNGGRCSAAAGSVKQSTFVGSLALTIVVCSMVGVLMYMRQQRMMKDQVRGILKEYMPLDLQNQNVDNAFDDDDDLQLTKGEMS